jgi:penicillin amidase
LWEGDWRELEVQEVEIGVKGLDNPLRRKIYSSHHGPILFPWLAMRWTGFELSDELYAILLLNRSQDWESFHHAISHFKVPPTNAVYGDIDGNIGYLLAGAIPLRSEGGWRPLPGWENEYEWLGFLPFEETPQLLNPENHYIISANQPPPPGTQFPNPIRITHVFGLPDRALRIEEKLLEKEKYSLEDFRELQTDLLSPSARKWREKILNAFAQRSSLKGRGDVLRGLKMIEEWTGELGEESPAAVLYEVFLENLLENIFLQRMGEDVYSKFQDVWFLSHHALDRVMEDEGWFDEGEREKKVQASFIEAVEFLSRTLGTDSEEWQWGRLHTVSFNHPLGRVFPLNRLFNLGPYPYGGDGRTLLRAQFPHTRIGQDSYGTRAGDTYRYLIDLSGKGDPADRPYSLSVLPPGQSGLWGSKHYGDQVELWLDGEVHENLMDGFEVESRLQLLPVVKEDL